MSTQGLFIFVLGCASAWLALAAYVLWLRRRHYLTRPLLQLCAASTLWTLSLIKLPFLDTRLWLGLTHSTEILRVLAWWWLVQAIAGARLLDKEQGLRLLRGARIILISVLGVVLYSGWAPLLQLPMPRTTITAGALVISALVPLVAMEQLYRNMDRDQRWAMKFIFLALVVSTAVDLITHFHTLVVRRIDLELWLSRGPVSFVTAALMAAGVRRALRLPARISLSHQLVFYSGSLLAAVAALLLVAAGYWYIEGQAGKWSRIVQALFLATALALLATAILSGRIRARFQVFLARHFLPYRYDYRMEWLRLSETLIRAASKRDLSGEVIRALARIVDSPAGLLFLVRNQTLQHQAAWNMAPPTTAPLMSTEIIARMRDRQWILDCHRDPPEDLPDWLISLPKAWLAIPLLDSQGPVALVVLGNPLAPRRLNWEDYDLLKLAARQAGSVIALQQTSEALGQARQFAALHQSTAFLAHDIKTMVAQLSLLVSNAERHRKNPEFVDDMIETVRHSVTKMENILPRLRSPESEPATKVTPVDLVKVARDTLSSLSCFQPSPELDTDNPEVLVQAQPGDLGTVIRHLVRNAQQACDEYGRVGVSIRVDGARVRVTVTDTGRGMTEDFIRDGLFTPFHSTKGLSGMGIGAFQSRALVEAMGGSLHVSSREGHGSCFTIHLKRGDTPGGGERHGTTVIDH